MALAVNLPVGVTLKTETVGTMTLVGVLQEHGFNLSDMP
jgi:hypothetical protein